jgi:hypothetical protein
MIYSVRQNWRRSVLLLAFCASLPGHRAFAQSSSAPGPATAHGIESNFEHGLQPYQECTTQAPNGVSIVKDPAPEGAQAGKKVSANHVAEFYWTSIGYDDTRMKRGAEACSDLTVQKEGWYGFSFFLPSPGYPSNTTGGIAQIFQKGYCNSWAGMLIVRDGHLILQHRGACGDPDILVIADKVRYNAWNHMVIHFVVSSEHKGLIEAWYNNEDEARPTVRAAGINFGFAHGWKNDVLPQDSPIAYKFGMYNFDDKHYQGNETRTLYYDNVVQISGSSSDAWKAVSSASAMPAPSYAAPVVR